MKKKVVISQPMFLPWIGIFEQIAAGDIFVHYDDAQFPQGRSFCSRVQLKAEEGTRWLSVPVKRTGKQLIKDVKIDQSKDWKQSHLGLFQHCYRQAQFFDLAMDLLESVYAYEGELLSDFCIFGIEKIANFLKLESSFTLSSSYRFTSSSTQRLLELLTAQQAEIYITGHGAKNYLDHELLESQGINVKYMDYSLKGYGQLYGGFTPYVSVIDLIANTGETASDYILAKTIDWKEFVLKSS